MRSLITSTDFLSNKPELRNSEESIRFKTLFGGTLTILISCLIIAASISFGMDLLERKNSSITYNLLPADYTNKAEIGNLPYMVALLDNGLKLLPEEDRWYEFLSESWDFYPKEKEDGGIEMGLKRIKIETERCNIDKHFGKYKELFKDVPYLEHHHCLIPGQNITAYGLYGSTKPNNFIDHWISTCVNDTALNKTNCYSREESKARLVNTYISYVFLDTTIDHNDILNPTKTILRSEILPVSSSIYKRFFFYLKNIYYRTDYGFIFEDIRQENNFQVSDSKENVDLRPEGTVPGSFALISVLMDKYNNFYFRKYYKAQNFLADMGGLIKGLLVLGYFLNYLISEEFYFIGLIESLYKVDIISEKERRKGKIFNMEVNNSLNSHQHLVIPKKKEEQAKNLNSIVPAKVNVNKENEQQKKNEHEIPVKKKIEKKREKIRITMKEVLLPSFCFKEKEKDKNFVFYGLAKNYIKKMISLKEIIQRFNDMDKLKTFLFEENTINVFENLKNPALRNLKDETKNIWNEAIFEEEDLNPENFERKLADVKKYQNKNFLEENIEKIVTIIGV